MTEALVYDTERRVVVNAPVSAILAVDRRPLTPQAAGDLGYAQTHLHQTAQAASLIKRQVAVSRSHGDPGHSRCRTWFVSLGASNLSGRMPTH